MSNARNASAVPRGTTCEGLGEPAFSLEGSAGKPSERKFGGEPVCKGWSGDRGGVGFVPVKEWEGELVGELAVVVGWSCGVWSWGSGENGLRSIESFFWSVG